MSFSFLVRPAGAVDNLHLRDSFRCANRIPQGTVKDIFTRTTKPRRNEKDAAKAAPHVSRDTQKFGLLTGGGEGLVRRIAAILPFRTRHAGPVRMHHPALVRPGNARELARDRMRDKERLERAQLREHRPRSGSAHAIPTAHIAPRHLRLQRVDDTISLGSDEAFQPTFSHVHSPSLIFIPRPLWTGPEIRQENVKTKIKRGAALALPTVSAHTAL